MAAQLLTDVAGVLAQKFDLRIRSQINRSAPLLSWLPKKAYTGKAVDWRVYGDGKVAATFASGADAPAADFDEGLAATVAWGRYHTTVQIAFDALIAALGSPYAEDAVTDLFEDQVGLAARTIGKKMNADLYAGAAAPAIVGLDAAVKDTVAYAGIDPAVDTWWKSFAVGTAGTEAVLALADLATIDKGVFATFGASMGPGDAIFCSPELYAKYGGLLSANAPQYYVNLAGGGTNLQGGFTGLHYNGIPFMRDSNATAARLYWLRRDSIRLKFLPVMQANGMPVQQDRELVTGTLGKDEPTQLMVHFNELGRSGAAIKYQVWVQCQLEVTDRFAHGLGRFKDA